MHRVDGLDGDSRANFAGFEDAMKRVCDRYRFEVGLEFYGAVLPTRFQAPRRSCSAFRAFYLPLTIDCLTLPNLKPMSLSSVSAEDSD
jgi:hypothetical protein